MANDIEIINKIAADDPAAVEELYDRYSALLYTLIKNIVKEKETAEETLEGVFLIAWKKIDQLQANPENIYTWFMTLARNKAVDTVRRKRGDAGLPDYTEEYENENIVPKLSSELEPLPLENVSRMNNKVTEIMNNLTDAQKIVLNMSLYEGLDENGIAGRLNIPSATVKIKLQNTMGILIQKLTR